MDDDPQVASQSEPDPLAAAASPAEPPAEALSPSQEPALRPVEEPEPAVTAERPPPAATPAPVTDLERLQAENRALQAAKDREVAALHRQQVELLDHFTRSQNQQDRVALQRLAQDDPEAFRDEVMRRWQYEDYDASIRQAAASQSGRLVLNDMWNREAFSGMSQEEKLAAYNEAQARAVSEGRDASVTEIIDALVKHRVRKEAQPIVELKDRVRKAEQEIAALRAQAVGEAIESETGPGRPAPSAPPSGSALEEMRGTSMSDLVQIARNPEARAQARRKAAKAMQEALGLKP